jgi:hypothetical protein
MHPLVRGNNEIAEKKACLLAVPLNGHGDVSPIKSQPAERTDGDGFRTAATLHSSAFLFGVVNSGHFKPTAIYHVAGTIVKAFLRYGANTALILLPE